MKDNIEIWKPIKGYEKLYEVSTFGNVRSLDRFVNTKIKHVNKRMLRGKVVSNQIDITGYYRVGLSSNSKVKSVHIHRLVCEAFISNPESKKCVNHKDGNKQNNFASNLEWCTYSENMLHAVAAGLRGKTRKRRTKSE